MSETRSLAGRHALITGGSRGIGYATAQRLAQLGARVTIMGRDAASLERAGASLSRYGDIGLAAGDVARPEAVQQAFAQAKAALGAIDILVNNAGQAVSQPFARLDAAAWQQMLAVNLTGVFHCMQAALPDMRENGWGRIVNVASTAGLIGYPYVSAYCAAKHGVIGLTRAVALETARQGITVNAVCPGYTETDIVHEAVANISRKTGLAPEQARAKLAERNPQGRLIQPEEVADAVAWLCGSGAASINGQALPVDGGEVMAG
ncbi:SDR family NAD(P)-dependent oxidoreductase [Pusillimonas sp. SM2304]|uniref:SDR family NAD(P)-dependent oxidoreductase n=1 Tax=Pusillimonas sp. SM2304 TaxID=3073241 RepID=UPI002876F702|nr:SDR family NAD(P)-dependent oxidoreductase [Pusillimonas sp. SM2304]MDS1140340.1 SDR family NAD(P)-dependent oxidoreductase [Pusillimonas sp. SM2304]